MPATATEPRPTRQRELPQVLSTLNRDGTRRWLKPRVSPGRFLRARMAVGYALIALFALMPLARLNGKPLMLLDLVRREFSFFGHTFLATDTLVLALFLIAFFIGIFLFTALLGRVWCGWACPQTVYMELVYRPIERLIDGTLGRGGRAARPRTLARSVAITTVYVAVSLVLAHVFLAYFVDVEELATWLTCSPLEHPKSFLVMAVTTALMLFNFAYFREQTCVVACPYGRVQSVLLDRDSLIISYDGIRGEPRGKVRHSEHRERESTPGDCIDCDLCVTTCPTGIDIRDGLQMECVACAQCIDACDAVMDKIGKPRGLIRYTSQNRLAGAAPRLMRPRTALYSFAIVGALTGLVFVVATAGTSDVTLLRSRGLPFSQLPDGEIGNAVQLKIANRSGAAAEYVIEALGSGGPKLVGVENPVRLDAGETRTVGMIIALPHEAFHNDKADVSVRVRDGKGFERVIHYRLVSGVGI